MTISQPGIKSNIFYCHTGSILMNAIATQDCTHDLTFRHSSPSVFIMGNLMIKTLYTCQHDTNNRYGQRICLEAWHINASFCALNRDDGSYLPQEYLHLVGK